MFLYVFFIDFVFLFINIIWMAFTDHLDWLHWLDVPERVKYKLSMITRRCLNGTAPQYLAA